ncbi:hypothetical protein TrVE_jg440 [Triparma verrucosa]|uniref:Dihydroorotate dehydrogenase (fumarate) n=1 Tax=Triparma verrucosa TaxID=1606542 RepID=A0A9W7C3Q2_9STRA|nr:hypothetical protein TrVE_jg440 [Triparma verrucosa]
MQVQFCGLTLNGCVYNASGPRTGSSDALAKVGSSKSCAILTKSATLLPQNGNPLPRTYTSPNFSINSEGLPNKSIDYYIDSETIKESVLDSGKPYFVSISGKSLDDNVEMMKRICKAPGVAGIELNLACPNVIGHPIIAYDMVQLRSALKTVASLSLPLPIGIKLPPYFDFIHYQKAAEIINEYKSTISYIVTMNTVGNTLMISPHSGSPVISPKGGYGGLSGPAVKPIALAQVRKFSELLDPSIDIVGVGGVQSGQDVYDMILCGAKVVQVGTCHWIEGPKCFDRIVEEFEEICRKNGVKELEEIRGKLKEWSKKGAALDRQGRKSEPKTSAKGGAKFQSTLDDSSFLLLSVAVVVMIQVLLVLLAQALGHLDVPAVAQFMDNLKA